MSNLLQQIGLVLQQRQAQEQEAMRLEQEKRNRFDAQNQQYLNDFYSARNALSEAVRISKEESKMEGNSWATRSEMDTLWGKTKHFTSAGVNKGAEMVIQALTAGDYKHSTEALQTVDNIDPNAIPAYRRVQYALQNGMRPDDEDMAIINQKADKNNPRNPITIKDVLDVNIPKYDEVIRKRGNKELGQDNVWGTNSIVNPFPNINYQKTRAEGLAKLGDNASQLDNAWNTFTSALKTDGFIAGMLGEQAPMLALTVAGGAVGGLAGGTLGAGLAGLSDAGQNAYLAEQAKGIENGTAFVDKDTQDMIERNMYAHTAMGTLGNLALAGGGGKVASKLFGTNTEEGIKALMKAGLPKKLAHTATGVGISTGAEALTEGMQSIFEERMRGNNDINWDKFTENAVLGGMMGGLISGVGASPTVASDVMTSINDKAKEKKEKEQAKVQQQVEIEMPNGEKNTINLPKVQQGLNYDDYLKEDGGNYSPAQAISSLTSLLNKDNLTDEEIQEVKAKADNVLSILDDKHESITNDIGLMSQVADLMEQRDIANSNGDTTKVNQLQSEIDNLQSSKQLPPSDLLIKQYKENLAHLTQAEQEQEKLINFINAKTGKTVTPETIQQNVDVLTNTATDTAMDTDTQQSAIEHITRFPMMYSSEDIDKVINNTSNGLSQEQRSALRKFSNELQALHAMKTSHQVSEDIFIGSKNSKGELDRRYLGIDQYTADINKSLSLGNVAKAERQLSQLGKFLDSHTEKEKLVTEALETAKQTGQEVQVVRDSNGQWQIKTDNLLTEQQRLENGAVSVLATDSGIRQAGSLLKNISNEVKALTTAHSLLSDMVRNNGGRKQAEQSVPKAESVKTDNVNVSSTPETDLPKQQDTIVNEPVEENVTGQSSIPNDNGTKGVVNVDSAIEQDEPVKEDSNELDLDLLAQEYDNADTSNRSKISRKVKKEGEDRFKEFKDKVKALRNAKSKAKKESKVKLTQKEAIEKILSGEDIDHEVAKKKIENWENSYNERKGNDKKLSSLFRAIQKGFSETALANFKKRVGHKPNLVEQMEEEQSQLKQEEIKDTSSKLVQEESKESETNEDKVEQVEEKKDTESKEENVEETKTDESVESDVNSSKDKVEESVQDEQVNEDTQDNSEENGQIEYELIDVDKVTLGEPIEYYAKDIEGNIVGDKLKGIQLIIPEYPNSNLVVVDKKGKFEVHDVTTGLAVYQTNGVNNYKQAVSEGIKRINKILENKDAKGIATLERIGFLDQNIKEEVDESNSDIVDDDGSDVTTGLTALRITKDIRKQLWQRVRDGKWKNVNLASIFFKQIQDAESTNMLIKFDNIHDNFTASIIQEHIGRKLTDNDKKQLGNFKNFRNKFYEGLSNIFNSRDTNERHEDYSQYLTKPDTKNELEDNVKFAMALGLYDWIIENNSTPVNTNEDIINHILHIPEDMRVSYLPQNISSKLRQFGKRDHTVSQEIGRKITQALGIKQYRNAPEESLSKLQNTLGMWAIESALNTGLLESQSLTSEDLINMYSALGLPSELIDQAEQRYLRVPTMETKDSIFLSTLPEFKEIQELHKGSNGLLTSLFKIERDPTTPLLSLDGVKKQQKVKRSSLQIPSKIQEYINKAITYEWKLDIDTVDVFNSLSELSDEDLAFVLGMDIRADTLKDMHIRERESVLASTKAEIDVLRENLEFINGMEDRTAPLFFPIVFWRNHRLGYLSKILNSQSTKVSRAMIGLGKAKQTISISNDKSFLDEDGHLTEYGSFLVALAENLEGVKLFDSNNVRLNTVDKEHPADFLPAFEQWLESDKVKRGTQAIQKLLDKEHTKNDLGIIADLVNEGDMQALSLRALIEWTKYQNAVSKGETTFDTSIPRSSDGVTNGPTFTWVFLGIAPPEFLEKFGIITKQNAEQGIRSYHDVRRKRVKDYYEVGSVNTGIYWQGVMKLQGIQPIIRTINTSVKGLIEASRKIGKDILTPTNYGSGRKGVMANGANRFIDGIYAKLTEAHKAILKDPSQKNQVMAELIGMFKGLQKWNNERLYLTRLTNFNYVKETFINNPVNYTRFKQEVILQHALTNGLGEVNTDNLQISLDMSFWNLMQQDMNNLEAVNIAYDAIVDFYNAKRLEKGKDIYSTEEGAIMGIASNILNTHRVQFKKMEDNVFNEFINKLSNSNNLLDFEIPSNIEQMLFNIGKLTVGNAFWRSFEIAGDKFIKARDNNLAMQKIADTWYQAIYNHELDKLRQKEMKWALSTKKNGTTFYNFGVSADMRDKLNKRLSSMLARMGTRLSYQSSNANQSGILLSDFKEGKLSQIDSNRQSIRVGKTSSDRHYRQVRSASKEFGSTGLAQNATVTQAMDGGVVIEVMNKYEVLDVHDSAQGNILEMSDIAREQNRQYFLQQLKQHQNLESARSAFNTMLTFSRSDYWLDFVKNQEMLESFSDDLMKVIVQMENAYTQDRAKLLGMLDWDNVHQYTGYDGQYFLDKSDYNAIKEELGNLDKLITKLRKQADELGETITLSELGNRKDLNIKGSLLDELKRVGVGVSIPLDKSAFNKLGKDALIYGASNLKRKNVHHPRHALLLKGIAETFFDPDISIVLVSKNDLPKGLQDAIGLYNAKTNEIEIPVNVEIIDGNEIITGFNVKEDEFLSMLVHELAHAHSHKTVANGRKNARDKTKKKNKDVEHYLRFERLMNEVHDKIKALPDTHQHKKYLLNLFKVGEELSPEEFLSYGYNDIYLQDFMMNTKVKRENRTLHGKKNGVGSFFNKFLRNIYNILSSKNNGKTMKGFNSKAEEWTAFEAFLYDSHFMMRDRIGKDFKSKQNEQYQFQDDVFNYYAMMHTERNIEDEVNALSFSQLVLDRDATGLNSEFAKKLKDYLASNIDGEVFKDMNWQDAVPLTSPAVGAGFKMTDLEKSSVQYLETVTQHFLNNSLEPDAVDKLRHVYTTARKKLTARDFHKGDWNTATQSERTIAQQKWAYLFKPKDKTDSRSMLARFSAMAVANYEVNQLLEISLPKEVVEYKGSKANVFNYIGYNINRLVNLFTTNSLGQGNDAVRSYLSDMAKLDAQMRKDLKQRMMSSWVNSVFLTLGKSQKKLSSTLLKYTGKGLQLLPFNTPKHLGRTVEVASEEKVRTILQVIKDIRDENKGEQPLGTAGELFKEIVTPSDIARTAEHLHRQAKQNETKRTKLSEVTMNTLLGSFKDGGTKLTHEDKDSLYRGLLETDAQSLLYTFGFRQLLNFLKDKDALAKQIENTSSQVRQFKNGNSKIIRAKDLGYFIATGNSNNNLMLNAERIAVGMNTTYYDANTQATKEEVRAIDELASLVALQYIDSDVRKRLVDVMDNESKRDDGNGVLTMLLTHRALVDDVKGRVSLEDPLSAPKGYLPEQLNPYRTIHIANEKEGERLISLGYKKAKELKPDVNDKRGEVKHVYYLEDGGQQRYISGAFSLTESKAQAEDITVKIDKEINQRVIKEDSQRFKQDAMKYDPSQVTDGQRMIPVMSYDGGVMGYRYEFNKADKDTLLERNTDAMQVMGYFAGNNLDKQLAPIQNKQVVDALFEDYKRNYARNPKAYVPVSLNSQNPEIRIMLARLPESTRNYIKNKVGEGNPFYIHNEALLTMFGYKKFSLGDLFNVPENQRSWINHLFTMPASVFLGADAQTKVYKAERIWQEIVSFIKDSIVIRSGGVLLGNIQANIMLLVAYGVNPLKGLQYTYHALKYGHRYRQDVSRKLHLELLNRIGQGNAQMREEISLLEDRIYNNPLREFIEAGMLSSIVEDVQMEENAFSFQSGLEKKVEKFTKGMPQGMKDLGNNLAINRGSMTHNFLADVTQFSDFAAKYVMYRHKLNDARERMSHEDALNFASDAFINYDLPTSKAMQYLNDSGLMLFTKFFFRFQKVLAHVLKHHPLAVAVQASAVTTFTDMATILEPLFLNRFGNPFESGPFLLPEAVANILSVDMVV